MNGGGGSSGSMKNGAILVVLGVLACATYFLNSTFKVETQVVSLERLQSPTFNFGNEVETAPRIPAPGGASVAEPAPDSGAGDSQVRESVSQSPAPVRKEPAKSAPEKPAEPAPSRATDKNPWPSAPAQVVDVPKLWNPTCDRWGDFRAEIYKPAQMAKSILTGDTPCDGECVAVCICGSLRTFFDPKVGQSIAGTLIHQFSKRSDVIFVVSEEHSKKGGVHVVPKEEQCGLYSKLNVVSTVYLAAGDRPKTHKCREVIENLEREHGRKYDWVIRPRPDSYWKQMNMRAKTATPQVYYRHNQFTMLPRSMLHNFVWPFRGTPAKEVDVNAQPTEFEFYLWRRVKNMGLKFRYYEWPLIYMEPEVCAPCARFNKNLPGPMQKLVTKAIQARDVGPLRRLRDCMHSVFSIMCHQLRYHFPNTAPGGPPRADLDIKALMQEVATIIDGNIVDNDRFNNVMRYLDRLQGHMRVVELVNIDQGPGGLMPTLQWACDAKCNPGKYGYESGKPWHWSCLKNSPTNLTAAMAWHPPGFAAVDAGELGEC